MPDASNRFNSFSICGLIAKGTGLGLKNLGLAFGLTWRLALRDEIVSKFSLNSSECLSKRASAMLWVPQQTRERRE